MDQNICKGCGKYNNNEKSYLFHKKICIYLNIHNNMDNMNNNEIKQVIIISNLLLFNNNIYPISKSKLLLAMLNKIRLDTDNRNIFSRIYNLLLNDNNDSYDYNNILYIISIITNINSENIININKIYKQCIEYISF